MDSVSWSLVSTVTKIPGEKVCTFSQRPKANPYNQPEMCPGQSNPFDFSSEEPAADTQDMINTGQRSQVRAQETRYLLIFWKSRTLEVLRSQERN